MIELHGFFGLRRRSTRASVAEKSEMANAVLVSNSILWYRRKSHAPCNAQEEDGNDLKPLLIRRDGSIPPLGEDIVDKAGETESNKLEGAEDICARMTATRQERDHVQALHHQAQEIPTDRARKLHNGVRLFSVSKSCDIRDAYASNGKVFEDDALIIIP